MDKSQYLNLSLPSRDNDVDVADINELSDNFRTIDTFCGEIMPAIEELTAEVAEANEPITTERIENGAVTLDKVTTFFFKDGLSFVNTDNIETAVTQLTPNKNIIITPRLKNKATEISAESTDIQIPSAKAVHDYAVSKNNIATVVDLDPTTEPTDEELYSAKAVYDALGGFGAALEDIWARLDALEEDYAQAFDLVGGAE